MSDKQSSVVKSNIMTEVSSVPSGKAPRLLGEVKDSVIYFDTYNKQQRNVPFEREKTRRRKAEYSFRRMKEMRESLRQAALINIVAAVNGEYESDKKTQQQQQQRRDSNNNISTNLETFSGNAMTVLSNLMLNKDRTISIPKPQVFNDAPHKFYGKKPLYYKHSHHEASVNEIEERKRHIYLSRTRRPRSYHISETTEEKTTAAEDFPISVTIQQISDENKTEQTQKGWIDSPAKVRIARSFTSRRRYASWGKKTDSRIGTAASLSKCDAVDILDPSDTFSNRSMYSESVPATRERTAQSSPRPKSYPDTDTYKGKSLPAIFPVKRKKFQDSPQIVTSNEKVKVASPFKHHTVNAYGGFSATMSSNSMNATKPLQMKTGHLALGSTVSGKSQQEIKRSVSRQESEPSGEVIIIKKMDPGITLEGRSMGVGSHPPSANSRERDRSITYQAIEKALDRERDMVQEIDNQFEELQKRISSKIADWSEKKTYRNSSNMAGYNVVGKGFKSSLSSAKSKENASLKGQKRVKFADIHQDDDVSIIDDTKSVGSTAIWQDEETNRIRAHGVANKIHVPSKPQKPMPTNELLRLRKRLMPSNFNQTPATRHVLLDNIRISRMRSKGSAKSSSSDKRSMISETDIGGYEDMTIAWGGHDTDATDRSSSTVPKSYGMSSFYPDKNYYEIAERERVLASMEADDCEDDDDDNDDDELENEIDGEDENNEYKVVKAIDLEALSGYQHRKFKKPERNTETTKTHFVKIKVK